MLAPPAQADALRGQALSGVVEATYLRGEKIYERGQFSDRTRGQTAEARCGVSDFTELIDLASERLGGAVLYANDDFFAPKENLLKADPRPSSSKASTRTAASGWTAGSRAAAARPATTGASSASACPGSSAASSWTRASSAATTPSSARSKPAALDGHPDVERADERDDALDGDSAPSPTAGRLAESFRGRERRERFTHLRFKIYPDGGVARLRVYGEVVPDWNALARRRRD